EWGFSQRKVLGGRTAAGACAIQQSRRAQMVHRSSFEAILKNTANLPHHTAIFWHLMNVDAAGVAHEQNAALNRLTSSANAPTFSFLDVFFGDGLLDGSMQSVKEGSELAAAVALRILGGEKAGDIKTPPTENALPKYDWRQMQRWGIAESSLPPGSRIAF